MAHPFRSLTGRLSLLLAAVFIAVLSGVGALLYDLLDRQMREHDQVELDGKQELVRNFVHQARSPADIRLNLGLLRDALVGHETLHVVLLDATGRVIFAASGVGATDQALKARRVRVAGTPAQPRLTLDMPYLSAAEQVRMADDGTFVWALIALETAESRRLLQVYLRGLIVTLIAGALLAGLAGFLAIRHGLAPIRRLVRTAEEVSASRLERRIPLEDTPSELCRLVEEFNAMLERLAASFRRLSDFSSDLAHELRTPIHSLLGHAQVALSRPRSAQEYRAVLETVAEEGERLSRTVKDMLFLAQADDASLSIKREHVDLAAELDKIAAFFHPLADERRLTLRREGHGMLSGDRNMVQRALTNLVSNAVRHAHPGSDVVARIVSVPGEVRIEIANAGEPIPDEHAARIFDRFYKTDRSRSDETGSTGLGLAIVKSIAELHGGRVELHRGEPGITTFRLIFPS